MQEANPTILSSAQIEALRRTCRQARENGFSFTQQAIECGKDRSGDTVGDFAAGRTTNVQKGGLLSALWAMFDRRDSALLQSTLRQVESEQAAGYDPVTNALHAMWTPDRPLDVRRLQEMEGHFLACMPFYRDDQKFLIAALDCGIDNNAANFEMVEIYDDTEDRITGKIVPADNAIMLVGQILGKHAPFIISLSGFAHEYNKVASCLGVALVGPRGESPTAHPIFIVRSEDRVQPQLLPRAKAQRLLGFQFNRVEQTFKAGRIQWDAKPRSHRSSR